MMKFSKFAERYLRQNPTLELMDDLGNANFSDHPVYMLGGGNPAHIEHVEAVFRNQLAQIASAPRAFATMVGEYDAPKGNAAFIHALADTLSDQLNTEVKPENIALTNGSQSSFGILFNSLAGEFANGERKKIVLPFSPEYIGYRETSWQEQSLFESRQAIIECIGDHYFKYHIDFNKLQLNATRHGAVCLSRPTNPSGNMVSDTELAELLSHCRQQSIPLIIDGAYGLPFPNIVFNAAKPLWNQDIILCLSLSKLGLPGLRTGIVVADKAIIDLITSANASNCLSPGSVGPALITPLLASQQLDQLCRQTIQPFYEAKLQATLSMLEQLTDHLPIRIHQPEGTMFLWLWIKGLPITSQELYQRLKAQGVYVIAGQHFFAAEDLSTHKYECIRLNYSGETSTVFEGIAIIAATLTTLFQLTPPSQ